MLGALRKLGRLFGRSAEAARADRTVRLSVEPLEDRRVLSVNAAITNGVLEINGTANSNDTVTVGVDANGLIEVTHGGGSQTFDPTLITTHNIAIDLGGGDDELNLALINRVSTGPADTQGFQITVDMGAGDDAVFVRENAGAGALLPSLDLSNAANESIHFGGGTNDVYATSGLELANFGPVGQSLNVFLDGSVSISTNGGEFDATDARISGSAAGFDLTINTGLGDAHVGVMNATGGARVDALVVNSGGDVTFETIGGAGNNVTIGSLNVHGATITVGDSISVMDGDATFRSDGLTTFDPGAGADIVVDTHTHDLTFISGKTDAPAFVFDSDVTFTSSGVGGAPGGGIVTFRPADDTTAIQIRTPGAPNPVAMQIDPADFAQFTNFDTFQIGRQEQSGTISVVDNVLINSGIDLHLFAGSGDLVIGAPVTVTGDVVVEGDGSTTTINANMTAASLTFLDDVLIGSNVTLRANGGAAGDISFASTIDSEPAESNSLVLDADDDITVTGAIGSNDALNNLRIDDANDVTFTSTVELDGNLTQDAGTGTTTFNGTGVAGIGGVLDVTTNAVVFNSADMVVADTVTVQAENAITLNAGAGINAGASTISLSANHDNLGVQGFTQNATAIIQTTNGTANAVSIVVGGTGSAAIGDVRATGAAGRVSIDSAGGAISGSAGVAGAHVTANQVLLDAQNGIGTDADGFDINADLLAGRTVTGDLHVVDTAGGLTIGVVGALTGARITAGGVGDNIRIAANGPLTVNSVVTNTSNSGNITLVAGGATAADDLTINANVTTIGGSGSISLFAGDSIQVIGGADVEASGAGAVLLSAGTDATNAVLANGTSTGSIVVNDGSEITTDDGDITLRAPGDVSISFLDADDDADGTRGDVFVQADFAGVAGGLSDNVGAISDLLVLDTANIVADRAELRAATGIGAGDDIDTNVVSIVAVNTTSGDINLTEVAAGTAVDVVQLSQAGAANINLITTAGSITVVSGGSGVTAGTGVVTLTAQGAASDIVLQQSITTAAGGSVSLVAGDDIVDDGVTTTLISTGNLSLSAVDNIGDITSFASGTGTPIDVAVAGLLQQAAITTANGEINIRAQGNLTAAAGAISPVVGGTGTALVRATGNLDVGTFGGLAVSPGDNLALLADGTLILPAGGISVGPAGALRLIGIADVQDGDHVLGTFTADTLEFRSGSAIATQITTDVAALTASLTTLGTPLTVVEQDGVTLQSVTTNNGDLIVFLASPGNMNVQRADAGTALVALIAAPIGFAGDGAILDGDGAGLDTVDVTGGQVLLLATQGVGTDLNALEIDGATLAASTVTGDINLTDVAGGVTVGTVSGFVGVQVTGGLLGDDVQISTEGVGSDLNIDAAVTTVGSGAISLNSSDDVAISATGSVVSAAGEVIVDAAGDVSFAAAGSITTVGGNISVIAGDDVSFTSTGSVTTATGNVSVDASGGIAMADGSQIVSTGGAIDLQAQDDIALSRVQANVSDVTVTSTGGAITDAGDLLGANISANQAALRAAMGIGAGNPLETAVNVLSARNVSAGNIEISSVTNPAFGALLTIGTVDGLAGVVNVAPGGAVTVTNFGPINVNSTVGATGAITLTAQTPTLLPVNAGILTLNAQVLAGGAVVLNAGNELRINDSGNANEVVGDTVTGNAGTVVKFGPGVIVRSTGIGAGAVADKLPSFTPLIPNVDNDQDTLDQLPFLQVFFDIGRPGETNLRVVVEFDVQGTTPGTFNGVNLNTHLDGTILDAGAGFFIRITVTDAAGITFNEAGTEVALPPFQFDFTPVFVPFLVELPRAEPLSATLSDPLPPTTYTALLVPIQQQTTFDDLPAAPDVAPSTDVRIIVVEKIGSDNQVEQDRTDRPIVREFVDAEAEAILENPSKLFEQLKSGRFRIWLKDGLDAPRNLIWDVILRDGRPQAGGEGTERPPTEIPGEASERSLPEGAAAPAPKTSDAALPEAAVPFAHAAAGVSEQDDSSGQRTDATELPLPPPSEQSLADHGWRITRRIDSGSTSPVRSNSP